MYRGVLDECLGGLEGGCRGKLVIRKLDDLILVGWASDEEDGSGRFLFMCAVFVLCAWFKAILM